MTEIKICLECHKSNNASFPHNPAYIAKIKQYRDIDGPEEKYWSRDLYKLGWARVQKKIFIPII